MEQPVIWGGRLGGSKKTFPADVAGSPAVSKEAMVAPASLLKHAGNHDH